MAERVELACMATSGRMTPRRMATREGLARMATRGGRMATWGELTRMATRGLAEGPPRTGTVARPASAVHGQPSSSASVGLTDLIEKGFRIKPFWQ